MNKASRKSVISPYRLTSYFSGVKFSIRVPAEFSFGYCYDFLCRSPKELLHHCENNTVSKLIRVRGDKVLIRVSEGRQQSLSVEVVDARVTKALRDAITSYICAWFDLDKDLKPFYRMASRDRLLKPLVKQYYGYRIVGQPSLFESLVWAVLGQQINVSFAYTLKAQFVLRYGERIVIGGKPFYLFPEPEIISRVAESELLALQFSRQKSRYTIAIAHAFKEGTISEDALRALSLDEAKALLMSVKGVGNWTANYALMKTFRFPNAFPREDVGIHNAIKRLLDLDRKPTLAEVDEVFRRYAGWEAYATLYLWRAL